MVSGVRLSDLVILNMNTSSSDSLVTYVQTLTEENEQLRSQLEEARFHPCTTNILTDAVIVERFKNIYNDVEQWTNTILATHSEDSMSATSPWVRKTRGDSVEEIYWKEFSALNVDAEQMSCLILVKAVMDFLRDNILYSELIVGISHQHQEDIVQVQELMKGLGTDDSVFDVWHKSTLNQLVCAPTFAKQRLDGVYNLVSDAERQLRRLLPYPGAFQKHEAQFRHRIVEATVNLHQALQLSRDDFEYFGLEDFGPLPMPFVADRHQQCRLIELETWRDVGPETAQSILCALFPGLHRVPRDSRPVNLTKPILVVSKEPLHGARAAAKKVTLRRDRPEGNDRARKPEHATTRRRNSDIFPGDKISAWMLEKVVWIGSDGRTQAPPRVHTE